MRMPGTGGVGGLLLAALGGVIAIAVVVVVGIHQQHARRIPAVSSVSIAVQGRPTLNALGRGPARTLAAKINHLPREPEEEDCDDVLVPPWVVRFDSSEGTVRVYVKRLGCPYVSIVSGGQDWGVDTWDASGDLRRTIEHDTHDHTPPSATTRPSK